jgi:hypothetical protein
LRYVEYRSQGACEEIVIFEETENSQVHYQADDEQNFFSATARHLQENSQPIVNHRGCKDENDEPGIPPHVKDIAGTKEQYFTDPKRDAVKHRQHDQKKDPVLKTVE